MIILLNYFSLHRRSHLINHKVSVMPRINFGRILIIAQPDCCRVRKQGGLVIINIILKIFQKLESKHEFISRWIAKSSALGCEKLQTALRAASLLVNLQITTKCMKLINLPI